MTVMERVVDEISYTASDRGGETVTIDGAYVRERLADLVDAGDLSKFIL
jgi:ATP-dependent HslUV protease ATP-binding subunit HslU